MLPKERLDDADEKDLLCLLSKNGTLSKCFGTGENRRSSSDDHDKVPTVKWINLQLLQKYAINSILARTLGRTYGFWTAG